MTSNPHTEKVEDEDEDVEVSAGAAAATSPAQVDVVDVDDNENEPEVPRISKTSLQETRSKASSLSSSVHLFSTLGVPDKERQGPGDLLQVRPGEAAVHRHRRVAEQPDQVHQDRVHEDDHAQVEGLQGPEAAVEAPHPAEQRHLARLLHGV